MNEYDENEDTKFLELVNELKWSITYELIRMSMNDFEGISSESLSKGERVTIQCLKSLKSLESQIQNKRTKMKKIHELKNEHKFFTKNLNNSINNN